MARGIASKWKQPIFVDFDTKMTKQILIDIIKTTEVTEVTIVTTEVNVCHKLTPMHLTYWL